MIIYYHCTRDSALLPSLLPLSFHEMIFILVPPVFLELYNALVRARNSATKNVITGSTGTATYTQSRIAHAQQKKHAYVCQWRLV